MRFGLGPAVLAFLAVSAACGLWIQNRQVQELQAKSVRLAVAYDENFGDFGGWHEWKWDGAKVDVEDCLGELPGYTVGTKDASELRRRVTMYKDGKTAFEWADEGRTVASFNGGILYLATYNPIASGCELSAVDLSTKKVLWKSTPVGLGPVQHSQYCNALNLHVAKFRTACFLVLYGSEGHGEYVEWVRADTGQTFFHRIFELR
jgi:hypothetical protein